jgi:hypothetical protein
MEKRGGLHWPGYVLLSSDHTHPRWRFQGHHRLKNIIVTLEYTPDSKAAVESGVHGADAIATGGVSSAAIAALNEGQRNRLQRVFQMYDAEGRGALSEERLRLVLADMGLDPEREESERKAVELLMNSLRASGGTNVDPTNGSLRVPSFEFLRVMQAQEFLRGETGRYWIALSLREAERCVRPTCPPEQSFSLRAVHDRHSLARLLFFLRASPHSLRHRSGTFTVLPHARVACAVSCRSAACAAQCTRRWTLSALSFPVARRRWGCASASCSLTASAPLSSTRPSPRTCRHRVSSCTVPCRRCGSSTRSTPSPRTSAVCCCACSGSTLARSAVGGSTTWLAAAAGRVPRSSSCAARACLLSSPSKTSTPPAVAQPSSVILRSAKPLPPVVAPDAHLRVTPHCLAPRRHPPHPSFPIAALPIATLPIASPPVLTSAPPHPTLR